jgi:transcriptional regulator with XRE-family HTH domain
MTASELSISVGARIRELREERKISQQELAILCNFEKSNMARIESGRTNPTLHTLYKISSALHVQLSLLVDFQNRLSADSILKP